MFAIVKFTEENDSPAIVSTNWIDKTRNICYFPNVRTEFQKNKFLLGRVEPKPDWDECPMKLLKEFASYVSAKDHLSEAELTSNLESDTEGNQKKRQRKERRIVLPGENSSSSDSEEEANVIKKTSSKAKARLFSPLPPPPPPPSSSPKPQSIFRASATIPPCFSPPPLAIDIPQVSSQCSVSAGSSSTSSSGSSSSHQSDILKLKGNQELMWKVVGELTKSNERLEKKLDTVIQLLQAQPSQPLAACGSENFHDEELLTQLPIKADTFETLQSKLKDPSARQRLMKYLLAIGGKDVKLLAAGLMRRLFLDEIGEKYSLTGKAGRDGPGKKAFIKTEIFRLVYDICLRKYSHAEESQIREAVSDWLMQAKFRKLRRESRKNKNQGEDGHL